MFYKQSNCKEFLMFVKYSVSECIILKAEILNDWNPIHTYEFIRKTERERERRGEDIHSGCYSLLPYPKTYYVNSVHIKCSYMNKHV